jgi:hypothetical protein
MAKTLVMLAAGTAAALTLGVAKAETMTSKSGNSTTTITQEPGTNIKRKVTKTPDGQTIIQRSGGGSATITQKSGGSAKSDRDDEDDLDEMTCPDKPAAKGKKSTRAEADDLDDMDDEDCPDTLGSLDRRERMPEFARRMDEHRRALNSDPTDDPKSVGPGFERLHAFKKKVAAWKKRVAAMKRERNETR